MQRSGFHLVGRIALLSLLLGSLVTGQTLSLVSARDGAASSAADPFLPTEMLQVTVTGLEPYRPVSFIFGPAGTPTPLAQGQVEIFNFTPFPNWQSPLDGLGLFGVAGLIAADATGTLSFNFQLSPFFFGSHVPGPGTQTQYLFQAISNSSSANYLATNAVDFVMGEPTATTPLPLQVTDIVSSNGSGVGPGNPAFFPVNSADTLIIQGDFFPVASHGASGMTPVVTFTPQVGGMPAAAVAVVPEAPTLPVGTAPYGVSLRVTPPPTLGALGLVDISIEYGGTVLFPISGGGPLSTVTATGQIFYQSAPPTISDVSPRGTLASALHPVRITGTDFQNGATVLFDGAPAAKMRFVDSTLILATPPAHAAGLVSLTVQNPDHDPMSPREDSVDFGYFSDVVGSIAVTNVSPATVTEQAAPDHNVTLTVTCEAVGTAGNFLCALDETVAQTLQIVVGNDFALANPPAGHEVAMTITSRTAPTFVSPGVAQLTITGTIPGTPPGLNAGLTSGGLSNCGPKSFRLRPPTGMNPMRALHGSYGLLDAGNLITYETASAPTVTAVLPGCVRADGGQEIIVQGTGFWTNDSNLDFSGGLHAGGPVASFPNAGGVAVTHASVQIQAGGTELVIRTNACPDAAIDTLVDLQLDHPDGRSTTLATGVAVERSFARPWSLPSNFTVPGAGTFTVPTVSALVAGGGDAIIYNFPEPADGSPSLTIPNGVTLQAEGDAPLIIRCRGDVFIDGIIDLRGGVFTPASPSPTLSLTYSAGGAPGGVAVVAGDFTGQDNTTALGGSSPLDASLFPLRFAGGGNGGDHGATAGGGGGGGFAAAGTDGNPLLNGGTGGASYLPGNLPLPSFSATSLLPPSTITSPLTELLHPMGGSGGGAGGIGFVGLNVLLPPAVGAYGENGRGGNGGGAVAILSDGTITLGPNAQILVNGETGGAGGQDVGMTLFGGGGGGGSGGGVVLASLQGVTIDSAVTINATPGGGGAGADPTNAGGNGANGAIRISLPSGSPNVSTNYTPATHILVNPPADLTGF